ncbi:trypsin-like peptidase domain-containing protein [Mumia sp. zg.B53]|uniref:S1C family serine protease n=1 Tax=unclassified Mumia TaxID=2621872 RepID=UPI001C6F4A69|nr:MULTISPECIES: trypsin-like peptidase domain-containing protein [unclassified Mumia]MBW9204319.1 trypsin-like peptidase domain-containing protein [Mumia sp. zg.B17]MBW9209696.1 trypsin-like peptidase domain-containing protein [Mumia sp. zg.B21]MBW9214300.1 trypsin-like peptidase domain-containing protein [Mumia sp. zg.B53]MDD9348019.1 trypsin-like peptidase domain-containing protein [Mumia sp.]
MNDESRPTEPVGPAPQPASQPTPSYAAPSSTGLPGSSSYTHRYDSATGTQDRPGEHTQAYPFGFTPQSVTPPEKNQRRGGFAAAVVAGALVAGLVGGIGGAAGYHALNDDSNPTTAQSSLDTASNASTASLPEGQVEKVAQTVLPSTVQLNVKGGQASGSGTGIIISSDGEILTNNHVIEAAADSGEITVSFSDGSIARAQIVGRDPVTDLAVVKAEGKSGLKPARLGNSADLRVGQDVIAIGSPYGLESTVTSGIISALNRPVQAGQTAETSHVFPAIQTDAAINPGNSGGPLVDANGAVIGVNSAIRTSGSGESGSIGLGFAIPIDVAKNVAAQLVEGKTVEHARIGVTVSDAVESDGMTTIGAEVKSVSDNSAAAKAGLKAGDVIVRLGDQPIASSDALVATIRGYQPGEKVQVTYTRGGQQEKTEITLDSDGGSLGS